MEKFKVISDKFKVIAEKFKTFIDNHKWILDKCKVFYDNHKEFFDKIKNLKDKFNALDKKKKAYIVVGFLIIFVMAWAFFSATIITSNFNRALVKENGDRQKVDAIGIIITETKSGQKYFEIYGENGSYSNDNNIATLNNVVGNFYKNGNVAMSFQSSKGSYNEKEGIINLYENTYIVLEDETSLEADSLVWTGADNDTIAEGNVRIKKGKEMIALADKCIIGAGYDKFKIVGQTQTKIYGDKK